MNVKKDVKKQDRLSKKKKCLYLSTPIFLFEYLED